MNYIVVIEKDNCPACVLFKNALREEFTEKELENINFINLSGDKNTGIRNMLRISSAPTTLVFSNVSDGDIKNIDMTKVLGHYSGRGDAKTVRKMLEGDYNFNSSVGC